MDNNPLKVIKEGILQHNLEKICNGFELLTGEKIKLQSLTDTTEKLIKKIEELLNNYKKSVILNPHVENNPPPSNPDCLKPSTPLTSNPISGKKGYYGNITQPLTEDVPLAEIDKNIKKAEVTKERKTKRSPPKKYNVKCSQCEQTFESNRQESKDFGQKCSKCLQETINGKTPNE